MKKKGYVCVDIFHVLVDNNFQHFKHDIDESMW